MFETFKQNWAKYAIEAWALGMFMLSASFFVAMIELPGLPIRENIADPMLRRWLIGIMMGCTAITLIYSPWGMRSGAHMNPAVTLAFLFLKKIAPWDAVGYIIAQTTGAVVAMLAAKSIFPMILSDPAVNYVQTLPGMNGVLVAFGAEYFLAMGMILLVLYSSNTTRTAPYTGIFAGITVMVYITLEAPLSGMSINPARTLASAVAAHNFAFYWIYLIAPPAGMLSAAMLWRWYLCQKSEFACSMSGKEN